MDDARNCAVIERLVKTLLWVYGGWRICIHGSRVIYAHLKAAYDFGGPRDFDRGFMSRVYERPFAVEYFESVADMPAERRSAEAIGRHLGGCRIGFDAGGSDRKVSAVIDGEAVFSEEVVWHPKEQADPEYHYQGIVEALRTAAGKMPRVDAIGVSSAGVYIDNRIMVASLFIKVPDDAFEKRVKNMYLDAAREIGADIPVTVANDGDVTALAGAMEMGVTGVLGIAMGTSEAGGYIDAVSYTHLDVYKRQPQEQGWLTATYMYDQTFNRGNVDYGSAIATLIVVLGVVLSNVANRVFKPSDDL